MSPVNAVPVEIDFDAVFETRPRHDARVGGWGVNHNRAARRTPAVVDPVIAASRSFTLRAFDVVLPRPRIPDIDRAVQLLGVMARDEDWQFAAGAGIRFDVFGDAANAVELLTVRLVGHVN